MTDTNFDISVIEIGQEQEQEPQEQELPLPPSLEDEESEADDQDLPEPVFDVTHKTVKTGAKKGNVEKKISLTIGNNIFKKRKKQKNGNLVFTCNGCEKEGLYLSTLYCCWC